jgi:hypothetical protein
MKAAVMRYVTALGMVGALTMNASLARYRNQLGSRHTTNMNMAQYCLPKENDPDQTKIYCWQDDGQITWKTPIRDFFAGNRGISTVQGDRRGSRA